MIKFYRALESSLRSSVTPYFAEGASRVTPVHSRHAVLSHDVHAVTRSRRPNQELPLRYAKSARVALRQIATKGYAKPYAADSRRLFLIGVNYNPKDGALEIAVETINETIKSGCETINETIKTIVTRQPGTKVASLIEASGKSRATVMRALSDLMSANLIEYRGSKKTGGYYIK